MTTIIEVVQRLSEAGIRCSEPVEYANGQHQVEVVGYNAVVNVWENGTCNVQGADATQINNVLGDLVGRKRRRGRLTTAPAVAARPVAPAVDNPAVFVVYGHDADARTQLECRTSKGSKTRHVRGTCALLGTVQDEIGG